MGGKEWSGVINCVPTFYLLPSPLSLLPYSSLSLSLHHITPSCPSPDLLHHTALHCTALDCIHGIAWPLVVYSLSQAMCQRKASKQAKQAAAYGSRTDGFICLACSSLFPPDAAAAAALPRLHISILPSLLSRTSLIPIANPSPTISFPIPLFCYIHVSFFSLPPHHNLSASPLPTRSSPLVAHDIYPTHFLSPYGYNQSPESQGMLPHITSCYPLYCIYPCTQNLAWRAREYRSVPGDATISRVVLVVPCCCVGDGVMISGSGGVWL
jgi:hypothetical protein